MADIRTFLAIELPGVVAQRVTEVIGRLSFLGDRMRWVEPEGAHLTLNFLGNISPQKVADVTAMVQMVARETAPLTLSVAGLGGFPDLSNARVVWLGVQGDLDGLRILQRQLVGGLTPLRFEAERRKYFPHKTLGRARSHPVDVDISRAGPVQPLHFLTDRLTVMKTELHPGGTFYAPLAYCPLKK